MYRHAPMTGRRSHFRIPARVVQAGRIVAIGLLLLGCSSSSNGAEPAASEQPPAGAPATRDPAVAAAEAAREWPSPSALGSGEATPAPAREIAIASPGDQLFGTQTPVMVIDRSGPDEPALVVDIDLPPTSSASGDFDGDGSLELVLGVPTAAAGSGAIQLLDGSSTSVIQSGAGEGRSFGFLGSVVVAGDFDGDGFDDVAASEPGSTDGQGQIVVLRGSGDGLQAPIPVQIADASVGFNHSLGTAMVTTDFDSDGFADLAVGAPGAEIDGLIGRGAVLIARGSTSGLGELVLVPEGLLGTPTPAANTWIGAALAAADFDGNGMPDLAAGAPGAAVGDSPDAGSVVVWFGLTEGLVPSNDVIHQELLSGEPERGDHFGASLAAGDFERNGRAELVIGVPGEAFGQTRSVGMIHVVSLSGQGIDKQRTVSQAAIPGSPEALDSFGAALEVGDVTGDDFVDLVVSTPGEALGDLSHAGLVQVLEGGPAGLTVESDDSPGFLREDQAADALFGFGLASSWPVTATTRVQLGRIENIDTTDSGRTVTGWAVISDAAASSIDETYVGLTVDGVRIAEVALTELRLDVARSYPFRGPRLGFEASVDASNEGQVCLTAQTRVLDCWDSP